MNKEAVIMKKVIVFVLTAAMLMGVCACGGNVETPAETTTVPVSALKEKTNVAEPLTWEKINAIPIADDSMTEEQLRQICIDAFRLQLTFGWTPSVTTDYNSGMSGKTFHKGQVYGGPPYQSGRFGNIYKWMYFYDEENGMLDLSSGQDTLAKICNQCTGGALTGWGRVVNSARYAGTNEITEANGCLRVGTYIYDENIKAYGMRDTYAICNDNGAITMWESYAALRPADGIVNYKNGDNGSGAGHVRMVVSVDVVRNSDGTVNGLQSTLTYLDQWAVYSDAVQSNGIPYEVEGGVDVVMSFMDVFNNGYLPFTYAELIKQDPVEKAVAILSVSGDSVKASDLARATIKSNYIMSDISVSITDGSGKEVYHNDAILYTTLMPFDGMVNIAAPKAELEKYADGSHTVTVSTRVSTGEKIVAYTGTLIN
jgi:hypothetical protein